VAKSTSLTTGQFQYVGDVLATNRTIIPIIDNRAFYRVRPVSVIQYPDLDFEQAVISAVPGKFNPPVELYDIDNIAGITNLDFSNNDVTNTTGLGNLKGLKYLACSYNYLANLDLTGNTNLTTLVCYGNVLTNIDLRHNTKLTSLTCSYNNLTTLNISSNRNLTYIFAPNNPLENIIVWWTPPESIPPTVNLQYSGSPLLTNP
jgi:hypothetical protein